MAEKTLNDVVNELKEIKNIVSETQSSVNKNKATVQTAITNSLKGLKLSNTLKGITKGLKSIKTGIGNGLRGIKDDFALRTMFLTDAIKNSIGGLRDKITAPFRAIGDKFNSLKDAISKPFQTITGALKGVGNFFANTAKGFLGLFRKKKDPNANNFKLLENIGDSLKSIKKGFSDFTEQLRVQANRAKEAQRELLEGVKGSAGAVPGGGGDGGDKVPGKAKAPGIFSKIGSAIGGVVGGIVEGIGGGFAKVGKKFKDVMAGALAIAAIGASLIPASKAFQMFGDVSWKAVGVGITVLAALVAAVVALGVVMSSGVGTVAILAGAAALAIIGAAMIPAAYGFQIFANAIKPIGEFLVNVMGGIAMVFERVTGAIGSLISGIVDEVKRLGELDGANLLVVAAGIAALGVALAAFGVGGAVGGIIGSIGEGFAKLLGGGESPMDRIFKLAEIGDKLTLTVAAIGGFGEVMKTLASNQVPDNLNKFLKDFYNIIDKGDFRKRIENSIGIMKDILNDLELTKLLALERTMNSVERAMNSISGSKLENLSDVVNTTGAQLEAQQMNVAEKQMTLQSATQQPVVINNVTNNNNNTSAMQTTYNNTQLIDDDVVNMAY